MLVRYLPLAILCLVCKGSASCSSANDPDRSIKFSVNHPMNYSNNRVTSCSVEFESDSEDAEVTYDVLKNVQNCGNGRNLLTFTINIPGVSQNQKISPDGLFFKRCSSDAAITNHGLTLQRIKSGGYGSALTNRPLKDDEIFTVRLDKKEARKGYVLGIGVTTHSPETLDVPNHLYYMKSGVWMFYHNHLYLNGVVVNKNYANVDLKHVQVGQTVGVMRSRYGNLHLFVNGVDQGPAASNMPKTVWGAFDLHGDALQATIINV